jgi:hypothetical protein
MASNTAIAARTRPNSTPLPRTDLSAVAAVPLLQADNPSDFIRNLRALEEQSKRSYSLTKAIAESMSHRGSLTGLEMEADQDLRLVTGRRTMPNGIMIPTEALAKREPRYYDGLGASTDPDRGDNYSFPQQPQRLRTVRGRHPKRSTAG